MPAMARRAPPRQLPVVIIPHARDRGVLRTALVAAFVLHLALLLIPFRFDRPVIPPPVVSPEAPKIVSIPIPPPPVAQPEIVVDREAFRPLPVPETVTPPDVLAPVRDTATTAVDAPVGFDPEILTGDPVAPPPRERICCSGIEMPTRLSGWTEPDYPEMARRARAEGTVFLSAVIGPDGRVEDVEVLRAPSPDLGFSESAIEAVRTWRYEPGRLNGRPVAVRMTVSVEFRLEG